MSGNSQESQEVSGKAPGKSPFPSGMVHKNPVSRSKRAGVTFSVIRILKRLREGRHSKLTGKATPVYIAAVLDYLTAEILELAGDVAREDKRKRITPRHITMAVRSDEELQELLKDVTFAEGGVVPFIHDVLLTKKSTLRLSQSSQSIKENRRVESEEI